MRFLKDLMWTVCLTGCPRVTVTLCPLTAGVETREEVRGVTSKVTG